MEAIEARDGPAGEPAERSRSRSLAFRIVLLVVLSVMAAQAVNLAVVLTSPPPGSPDVEPGEAAAALLGKDASGTDLAKWVAAAPPHDNFEDRGERSYRRELARQLSVTIDRVRVVRSRPDDGDPPGTRPPPGPPGSSILPGGPDGGSFVVAAELERGRWTTLSLKNDRLLEPWQQRALLWFVGTALIVCPLAYAFARHLAAPIRAFAEAAERLGKDPSARSLEPLQGPAELGAAATAFNRMQARIQRYVEDRTGMIAAIAHDMRTPLMRLSFRVANAPDGIRIGAERDIAEMEAMIAATLDFVKEVSYRPERVQVDLTSLVLSVADDLGSTGAAITVFPSERLIVHADPSGMRRVITNLLVNAVKYGDRAEVRVLVEDASALIEIADEGPGMGEYDLNRAFEPFFRAEQSRNRETGGMGLGLAVVRTIVHQHGGEAVLANRPEGGLLARVVLPI
ncbi:ATP-binding protein [Altericroceibacterium xinjiangense]|uniref:ATP-binding protein n=1 Tax=Altericroceibacterium xinjiangense TaxID=762261 RepID=UPI000F7F0EF3|nr:ATP-binding protein [Altericroceibacterium xinjiangense]